MDIWAVSTVLGLVNSAAINMGVHELIGEPDVLVFLYSTYHYLKWFTCFFVYSLIPLWEYKFQEKWDLAGLIHCNILRRGQWHPAQRLCSGDTWTLVPIVDTRQHCSRGRLPQELGGWRRGRKAFWTEGHLKCSSPFPECTGSCPWCCSHHQGAVRDLSLACLVFVCMFVCLFVVFVFVFLFFSFLFFWFGVFLIVVKLCITRTLLFGQVSVALTTFAMCNHLHHHL